MTSDHTTFNPRSRASYHTPKKRPSGTFWLKAVAEFSKSGLSVQQFCRLKRLAPSNFYTWRKRLREEESNTPPSPPTFLPLEVLPINPLKESPQSQQLPFSPNLEKGREHSGLILKVNSSLTINIDEEFHGPTLQRLIQLFSSKESATC